MALEDNLINGNKLSIHLLTLTFGLFVLTAFCGIAQANPKIGEAEFKEYCAACHADGGNIINPAKTLSKMDREKNGIKTTKDIIQIMRRPGEGMSMFDEKTLPDAVANMISEYIITTYK